MRIEIKEIKIFNFNEASKELKDKIIYNFSTIYDIYDACFSERVATLEKLAEILKGSLDYSLSCVPDRGECIKISPKYENLDFEALKDLDIDNCPLTGVCYDYDILKNVSDESTLNISLNNYITSIHDEFESMLEDDYLSEWCEASEYEFTEDGCIY